MSFPQSLYPLFWDCRPETLDLHAHTPFILERILEYTSLTAVRWALDAYGRERVTAFLRHRGVRTLTWDEIKAFFRGESVRLFRDLPA